MAPVRQDLLALTPQAIVSLSNKGFFDRATKEVAAGKVAAVAVSADGVVEARFVDGVKARLVPGKALKDCPCTCGATSVCRHRVAAILAYQRQAGAVAPPGPALRRPWSPGEIDDAALEKLLGKAALERARRLRRRGVLVEIARGSGEGEALPRAQLATSSVRFLVPGDVGYARCDCRLRTGCEHVAVAVWAFQAADRKDPGAPTLVVEVSDEATPSAAEKRTAGLDAAREIASAVLLEGASRLPAAVAARFALAREGLTTSRLAWPLDAVEELEELIAAYGRRSARYSPERVGDVLAEILARVRSASAGGELPSSAVLGSDVALEADLDQVRLSAVGARVEPDGRDRVVEVLLADPSSQTVLVLRHRVATPEGQEPEDGPALSRRAVAGSALGILAASQILSAAARRSANRRVSLRRAAGQTSVLAGGFALDQVPAGLVVRDCAAFARGLADRPPRLLRPRLLAETARAFLCASVVSRAYDPAEQAVRAVLRDPCGGDFEVELRHRSVAPGALGALALALASGKVSAVVGEARKRGPALVVEPVSLVAEGLTVLDLAPPTEEGEAALGALEQVRAPPPASPIERAAGEARALLAEVAHVGLRGLSDAWAERLRAARRDLADHGLERLGADLEAFELARAAAGATGTEIDEARAVEAWATAEIRLELLGDRL